MTEDFNEGPVAIEDKHSTMIKIDKYNLYFSKLGHIECCNCHQKFFIEKNEGENPLIMHLKENHHNSIKIIPKQKNVSDIGEIKCFICEENNIYNLSIIINTEDDIFDIKKYIFCKNHLPKGYQAQSIIDLIELDDIINRKFNKVKLKYDNKDEYYQIYKPLLVADMIYTRKIYDNKKEYDIELLSNKREKYYFNISEDFNEINFALGRVLKFSENKIKIVYEEEQDEENEPLVFLAIIVNITPCEENDEEYSIWILPINKHITSLKGHTGKYKMKEEFCIIPYQRMSDALDLFVNDDEDDSNIFDRPVSLYLIRRLLGHSSEDIKKECLAMENNALKNDIFKDIPPSQLVTSLDKFGKLNDNQIKALKNIFFNVLNLIQGPPGTGKTFLSSFIVYNIFKFRNNQEDKILLCSPSNSAADNLALNLLKLNNCLKEKMKILRIYSKSREFLEIDKEIEKISLHKMLEKENVNQKEIKEEIIQEIVSNSDIVISTCSTSWDDRIKKFNFPFVLIDEITQCCEIEALISIVHGCKHLILIGDQKQLGPVVLHPKANITGMRISLFERLIKLYPDLLNMLTIQYRMHPEISKFPSIEFYENKIINGITSNQRINEDFNDKFNWPNKNIPLIFLHSIEEETAIQSGKSKQNNEEAKIVTLFIDKLIKCGIDFKNIGIITPYTAQKLLINKKLKEKYKQLENLKNLKISSVNGFQGGEKDFIILSNVRSNKKNQIGFLKDFRLLNVSITRAKYGMIVVGNANCLYNNKSGWKNYINYCQEKNLIYIPEIKKKANGEKEICIDNLKNINISHKNDYFNYLNSEYDFDGSGNILGINQDLLYNFECSQNVYAEGNKKYYKKKKDKKNKKKKKNK